MKKNVLLICGSLNQTMMLHQVAQNMPEYASYYTPFYAEDFLGWLSQAGLLDFTILGGHRREQTTNYLNQHHLPIDFGGRGREYDLVITGTDLLVQNNIVGKRLVLVQEGMTEPEDLAYQVVRKLKLPRYLANTSMTGLSNAYDIFCVASNGYRDLFVQKGVPAQKIVVTGIPNFDHAGRYLENAFPYHHYVLAVTSSLRESFKFDNRMAFLHKVKDIAAGRPVIFKLHPSEWVERATREIHLVLPEAMIFTDGNAHEMIANCDVLVAQRSSAIYTAVALGKEVYADMDLNTLRYLLPVQNGGRSANRIAQVCRQLVELPAFKLARYRMRAQAKAKWRFSDQLY